jgi:small-conductance mechanosensitive channel
MRATVSLRLEQVARALLFAAFVLVAAPLPASPALAEPVAGGAPVAGAPPPVAAIKVHGTTVLTIEHGLSGRSAAERANTASKALQTAIDTEQGGEVRVERRGDRAMLWAGKTLLLELSLTDAGAAPLDLHATRTAAKLRDVIREEQRRSDIADTVLSISLVVFFAMIAFYALRKAGELADRAYGYLAEHPERVPGISFQSFEVVGPKALRSGLLALIALGRYTAQLGILYVWLVVALSRFEATRPLTERLTSFALTPITELAVRLAATLPIGLVAVVFGVIVYVLVRFTRLFFASVASGETKLEGLPRDLAPATGSLASIGIVIAALAIAGPLVTGDAQGSLARVGSIALLAIGLASTPLLASAFVGARLVFSRRLPKGEHVEFRGHVARVREVTLLETRLLDEHGVELRVPHLLALVAPLRVLGRKPRIRVELWIETKLPPSELVQFLISAATAVHDGTHGAPRVELIDMHPGGGRYRVTVAPQTDKTESDLRIVLVSALAERQIALAPSGAAAPATQVS